MEIFNEISIWFVSNLSTIATWVTIFAPLLTIVAIIIALVTFRHERNMTDPWALTKIDDDLWLLRRTIPKLASIWGIRSGDDCRKNSLEFDFIPSGSHPTKYFRKGTDILIRIDSSKHVGMVFALYYEEPRRERSMQRPPFYRENMNWRLEEIKPRRVKVWKTTLY